MSRKSEIRPYQRRQSSSGLHRPGAGREGSLLLSSLPASGAGQTHSIVLGKTRKDKVRQHQRVKGKLMTLKENLAVECRVTELLPEGVQSLLNYLLPVRHGKLPQGEQDSASFLGQGL